jgi:hypothetical protein
MSEEKHAKAEPIDHSRKEGARTKGSTAGKAVQGAERLGMEWKFAKNPVFLKERLACFMELFEEQTAKMAEMPQ